MKKSCDLLIHNAQLITCADNGQPFGLLENGAVACNQGQIIWLGSAAHAAEFTAEKTIDAEGQVVTPGLIDCHTHLVFAGS
ncbi:Imidazolonepropionase, partial [hydrothermal vent metagenome]